MKKLLITALAGLTFAAPFAIVTASAQPGDRSGQGQYQGHRDDRDGARRDDARREEARRDEARREDRRDRRDRRRGWREDRRDARWDDDHHNGYYSNNRWHYGPPSSGQMGRVTLGYRPWVRGQRLGYYDGRYHEVDYRQHRNLRRPQRGYHWVRNDNGDFLLAAILGGLITQVIINQGDHYRGR